MTNKEKEKSDDDGSENIENSLSNDENEQNDKNLLFDVEIQLTQDKTAKLYISENDDIDKKVKDFCAQYKINPELEYEIKKRVQNKLYEELKKFNNDSFMSFKYNENNLPLQQSNNKNANTSNLISDPKQNNEIYNNELTDLEKNKKQKKETFNKKNISNINDKKNNSKINTNQKAIKNINKKQNHKTINDLLANTNTKVTYNKTNKLKNNEDKNSSNTNKKDNKQLHKNNKKQNEKLHILKIYNNNKINLDKRPNSSKNNRNFKTDIISGGERMYNDFKRSLENKKQLLLQTMKNKIKEEDKDLKFKPEIDKNSRRIMNQITADNSCVEERLIYYGNKINQKRIKEKTNILYENSKNNTFAPKIDDFSRFIADKRKNERINDVKKVGNILNKNKKNYVKIMNLNQIYDKKNRSNPSSKSKDYYPFNENINNNYNSNSKKNSIKNSYYYNMYTKKHFHSIERDKDKNIIKNIPIYNPDKNIFDYLYLESRIEQEKKKKKIEQKIKEDCTFIPKISNYAKKLKQENKETSEEFYNRMYKRKYNDKYKNAIINNDIHEMNLSFRPNISRGPKNPNQRENSFNKDSYHYKRITKSNEMIQNNENLNNKEKKEYFKKRTDKLINKMKFQKYKELFSHLDGDGDGLISKNNINLAGIDEDILTSLSPILKEIEEEENQLDFKTFCSKIEKIFYD